MFSTILASVSLVASLQAAMSDFAQREQRPVDRAWLDPTPTTTDPLDRARAAMSIGEFDAARREFRIAADSARAAGTLPVEALRGLTVALYAQGYTIEAAWTMEGLGREAMLRGDRETEALALADAIWLYVDGEQRIPATRLHKQLCAIAAETPLTAGTLTVVRDRVRGLTVKPCVATRPAANRR